MITFTAETAPRPREEIREDGKIIGHIWLDDVNQWWQCQIWPSPTSVFTKGDYSLNGIAPTREGAIVEACRKGALLAEDMRKRSEHIEAMMAQK